MVKPDQDCAGVIRPAGLFILPLPRGCLLANGANAKVKSQRVNSLPSLSLRVRGAPSFSGVLRVS
ncbi:MAG: hypothetical protein DME98_03400 [Verrucomicrobia bacterium]|nr:MAG: hypothetical protein DMF07_12050 [Verrucomicrobiota bacterium]PYI98699.1 MAG: hypothetical protein DME98_03400 [Verrucomicrobiota bacterium]